MTTLLSIILPTYNERENLPILLEKLEKVLEAVPFEVVVVDDDSPDGTWQMAQGLAAEKPYLYVVRRVQERGLASAVMAGFTFARGKYLVVMDCDLQHDEGVLPAFLEAFQGGAEIVVGTRRSEGGELRIWSPVRRFVSWCATLMAKLVLPITVTDPLSGFFGVTRNFFREAAPGVNPRGFKILLEFLAQSSGKKVAEVGFVFRNRLHGKTKLSGPVILDYLIGLYDLKFGKVLPVRFLMYSMVGVSGIFTNQFGLWLGRNPLGMEDHYALSLGIELSILSNFFLNNYWSFRDVKITGGWNLAKGILLFNVTCLAGAVINYAVALLLSIQAGLNIYGANLVGIAFATAWNYNVNLRLTWKQ